MTTTLDQRINGLEPERSGNGKWLRFVRHTPNGFTVFKTTRF